VLPSGEGSRGMGVLPSGEESGGMGVLPSGEGSGGMGVHTPGAKTIADLQSFFGAPASAFLKSVFYFAPGATGDSVGTVVVAAIRGDLDVNEAKLRGALGAPELRLATEAEVRAAGIVPGYGSPVGLPTGAARIVVDDSVPGRDFIAGANREDYHLRGVRFERDFAGEIVADIAVAGAGQRCAKCGAELQVERGIELGHTFKLGTRYSAAMGATFLDGSGQQRPIVMGCYGIGLGRLLAAVVEGHHDDHGIAWPEALAPYRVYLCPLGLDKPGVADAAERLYADLLAAGVEVLYDDRNEAPGVKFADADLIGVPWRIIVSARSLQSASAEVKRRGERQATLVSLGEVVADVFLRGQTQTR
jgi:prolyl-tRNA synthetase